MNTLGRILLVDDEEMLLEMAGLALSAEGYQVVKAKSGHEALEAWDNCAGEFDFLVTDLVMPGLQGDALAAELRGRKASLRTVLVSGSVEYPPDRHRDAIDTFVRKPYSPQTLAGLLETLREPPR